MNKNIVDSGWLAEENVSPTNFKKYLKDLSPYLQKTDEQHFRNLMYIAAQDLSLAHCLQHNHLMRVAVQSSGCDSVKELLTQHEYHELVGCYGSYKAIDTVQMNKLVLSGHKGWLTNLLVADIAVFQVPDEHNSRHHVLVKLGEIFHSVNQNHPGSIGMKGAAPGKLIFEPHLLLKPEEVLNEVGSQESFATANYASFSFITNHIGLIIGLYRQLLSYKKTQDPELTYRCKMLELDIAALKMSWEDNLPTTATILSSDAFWNNRNTQFAQCKKVLLALIQFVLEMGIHNFIDDSSHSSTRFKDALTFVTHMASLHRCHKELYYTKF